METLYTRVSPDFDKDTAVGVVLAAPLLGDTYGFTELGYDEVDYTKPPKVLEIESKASSFATNEDVYAAADEAGIKVWLTFEEYMEYTTGAVASEFEERKFLDEETNANELLENKSVQDILEAKGFDAFRDHIVVTNYEPLFHVFWKPGTFEVKGLVEVVGDDPEHPYHVRLASETPSPGM